MSDEPPVESLHFTQHLVLVVERWPERIRVVPDLLANPHVYGATYDSKTDLLEFSVFNGGCSYKLDPPGEAPNGRRIGVLVPGSDKKTTRRP